MTIAAQGPESHEERNPPGSRRRLTGVEDDALTVPSALGRITISPEAVAQIVGRTAAECYGVVGMSLRAPGAARERVNRLLPRGRGRRGIVVRTHEGAVAIDLYVVVEYGLNLAEVAATVRSRVAYEVERLTGLEVASVDVHIQAVKRSA